MKNILICILLMSSTFTGCANIGTTKSLSLAKSITQIKKLNFSTSKDALVYIFERRLEMQRQYENTTEPHLGKPEEKNCTANVDLEGKLQKFNWGSFLYLKVLVNDHLVIGDCLLENNAQKALYEFYLCGNAVLEKRTYTDKAADLPNTPTTKCDSPE